MARSNMVPARPSRIILITAGSVAAAGYLVLLGAVCFQADLTAAKTWLAMVGVWVGAVVLAAELIRRRWWRRHSDLAALTDAFLARIKAMPLGDYVSERHDAERIAFALRHRGLPQLGTWELMRVNASSVVETESDGMLEASAAVDSFLARQRGPVLVLPSLVASRDGEPSAVLGSDDGARARLGSALFAARSGLLFAGEAELAVVLAQLATAEPASDDREGDPT